MVGVDELVVEEDEEDEEQGKGGQLMARTSRHWNESVVAFAPDGLGRDSCCETYFMGRL